MVISLAITMAGKNRTFSKVLVGSRSCLAGPLKFVSLPGTTQERIYRFDRSKGVTSFPESPADAVSNFFVPTVASTPDVFRRGNDAPGSNDKSDDLGMGLKPGDPHYRA
jgi:hypothetical protein